MIYLYKTSIISL